MANNYSSQVYNKEHMARGIGRALPISTKASIEICNSLRKKPVAKAKTMLKDAMDLKTPIKFTRFTNGAGHKKGMMAGKYPQKAAKEIFKLIESIESNAQFKGLNTSDTIIKHISAQKGGNAWRYGRFRRRKAKRTNIEIVIEEGKSKKNKDIKKEQKEPSKEKKAEEAIASKKISKEPAPKEKEVEEKNVKVDDKKMEISKNQEEADDKK